MNLFSLSHERCDEEIIQTLVESGNCRIERIISEGHRSPPGFWYDQTHDEWVAVLRGAAEIEFEQDSRRIRLESGDTAYIPAHTRHRVAWTADTEKTIWLAVHI
jgi:cupin 2 domain-containing protein